MNTGTVLNIVRLLFLIFSGLVGASLAIGHNPDNWWMGSLLGAGFAALIILLDTLLRGLTIRSFSHGTIGLLVGMLCAWLVTRIGLFQSGFFELEMAGTIFNLCVFLAFGFIGVMLALRSKREEFSLLIPYVRFRQESYQDIPTLVDKNIIIDGRLPGICAAGFLGGSFIVPRFVFDALQEMTDSRDKVEQDRGRRGLDALDRMQKADDMDVTIFEEPFESHLSDDARMVEIADILGGRILTNDTDLAKLASVRGIAILNLDDLALAMRPVVAPGDELRLELVKEGKDDHQAVGFLPDGTMIVVNQGKPHIGKTRHVVIGSAVQTTAGRLIFAELA